MAASYNDIREWLYGGNTGRYSHMIVVCDTWDYDDYPVFVAKKEDVNEKIKKYRGNMQQVMEVYNYSMNLEEQLSEGRAYHIETEKPILKLVPKSR